MLRRKFENILTDWKNNPSRLPLLLDGARQVGKTTVIREFAHRNYETVYELNFFEHPEYVNIFSGSLDAETILMNLSMAFPEKKRAEGSTLIFLDEIQHCPSGRTALKFLAKDSRFDVIASGSLLGLNHCYETSLPVGYVTEMKLYPLDFEEFLWAMGIGEDVIDYLRTCYEEGKPVEDFVHQSMLSYFSTYMIIGGMPAVVSEYARNKDYVTASGLQHDIVSGYKKDVVKYADEPEKAKILRTFDSITSQLSKDYKKFQYSIIEKGARARNYGGSLLWLKDAGIVSFCRNLSNIQAPLSRFSIENEFKIYMNDTGLLVSMYEAGTAFRIMNGELGLFKGALYENIIAQALLSGGFPLYYFSPSDSLEIDFVIMYENHPCLVEVKSGENRKSKSLDSILSSSRYAVDQAIRFSRGNVGRTGKIIALPLYMSMFMKNTERELEVVLPDKSELMDHIRRLGQNQQNGR